MSGGFAEGLLGLLAVAIAESFEVPEEGKEWYSVYLTQWALGKFKLTYDKLEFALDSIVQPNPSEKLLKSDFFGTISVFVKHYSKT